MRTINENFMTRLIAQRDEAKLLGLNKIATNLTNQISSNAVRDGDENYEYSYASLKEDVEENLWDAAIRAQDYFGNTADAREISDIITVISEQLINEIRVKLGKTIGAYEPVVPGEDLEVEG